MAELFFYGENTMNEKETVITQVKNLKDYEKILFCMKAMGGKRNVLFTRYMHIENTRTGSRIVCTDGKRLHVANISIRIPAGNYQPEIKDNAVHFKNPSDIVFPSWKNVVPEEVNEKGTVNLEEIGNGSKLERDEKFSSVYCSFLFNSGINVNMGFLKDLPCAKWKILTQSGEKKLVKLVNTADKNQFAVFVPLVA